MIVLLLQNNRHWTKIVLYSNILNTFLTTMTYNRTKEKKIARMVKECLKFAKIYEVKHNKGWKTHQYSF